MSEEKGNLLIKLALILILLALLLMFNNWWEDFSAGNASHTVISDMQSALETQEAENEQETESKETRPLQMQEAIIDGYAYIGYLNIPALGLELPVLSEWSEAGLKIAPARHFGAAATDDLVIAAHNYRRHFGALGTLKDGDEVTFTEMDGYVNHYVVRKVVTIKGTDLQEVMYNPYDLVLYTCTTGGKKRLAAYCERVDAGASQQ
ncbi:MAG: sortase [Lachnospiraceae bacterium]|nr:sortase [Lachnospiraceae bacterium]